ncbi:MAG: VWA domain-containing protein, partial [Rhodanobacter sp.]
MSEALHQFHFLQPMWLLALVALPLLLWLGARGSSAQQELSRLVDAELLPHLLYGRARSRRLPFGLFALGWLLGVLALAGPTWSRIAQPLYTDRAVQVVAISLSQSMLARDVTPSRIDRARYKAHDLLASNNDGLNGLIGYAGESFVVAPLTSDVRSLNELLDAMAPNTMPVDGNNAAQAIAQGVALIHDAKADAGSLVLLTDTADATAQEAASKALAAGVHVSVLGVGTAQGGPVPLGDGSFLHDAQGNLVLVRRDDAALTALATAGGGTYVPMSDDGRDIAGLHAQLQPAHQATMSAGQQGDAWQDRGPWLLLPLLLIAALAFRRGWLL